VSARVDHLTTVGQFSLDGGTWDVENNVWIVGDDEECLVVDAPHDAAAINAAIGDRRLAGVVCTHAHNDHINAAVDVAERGDAPIWLHPADLELWAMTFPDRRPSRDLLDGMRVEVAGTALTVIHTPGHSPGSVCLADTEAGLLFSGDTLFKGGPGATGRSFSDFPTILHSISERLFRLPGPTIVHPGHGESTRIGDESPHYEEWVARGH